MSFERQLLPGAQLENDDVTSSRHLVVHAQVCRSGTGEPYIRTLKPGTDSDDGDRVFVSDGASMLFWRKCTYRLVWNGGHDTEDGPDPPE